MSWPVVELGSVVSFIGGSQPPKSTFKYELEDGYVRLLQIRDYKSDNNLTYIPMDSTKKFCSKDDVMIGRYGPPVFQILRGLEGAYNVALMKAQPNDMVDNDYLFYFLKQDKLFRLIDGLSQRTAGQSGVDMDALKAYPMLLPPLEEQKRIVAILDKADSVRRKRQKAIDLADDFLRSVFLDMFGDPICWDESQCPKDWSVKPIEQIAHLKRGYDLPVQSRKDGQVKVIAANGPVGSHDEYKVKGPGVITGRSGTIGKVMYSKEDFWPLNTSLYVTDFHGNNERYIEFFLRHLKLERYTQGAGVPTLNRNLFLKDTSLVPPRNLQDKFEAIYNSVSSIILKFQSSSTEELFSTLSQRAFAGEL